MAEQHPHGDAHAAAEAKLVALCEDLVMQGDMLAKNDILALQEWFQEHHGSDIPAIARLGQTLQRVIADGKATQEEQDELLAAIRAVVDPEVRTAVQAKQSP